MSLLKYTQKQPAKQHNVCFKKTWTNHSSDTVLRFVQVFFETDVTKLLILAYNSLRNFGYEQKRNLVVREDF